MGRGKRIVDLGCAPGGWTQIAALRNKGSGEIVGMDLLPTEPIEGAVLLQQDFTSTDAPEKIKSLLHGPADVVVQNIDHLRTIALVEAAYEFAKEILSEGGIFIAKVFQGGTEGNLLNDMKKHFTKVVHHKPDASRQDSVETYVVAIGFKG